jgi:hypothetical protein
MEYMKNNSLNIKSKITEVITEQKSLSIHNSTKNDLKKDVNEFKHCKVH